MIELRGDRLSRGAVRYSLRNSAEFKEDEHPRAADGKFGSGGSSEGKNKSDSKISITRTPKRKSGGEAISKRLEDVFIKMGFSVEKEGSALSDSQYLTLTHENEEPIKIRISDHDLPPSYSGLHGHDDYDIYSENRRMGTDGNATDYIAVIKSIAKKVNKNIPEQEKTILDKESKEAEDAKKRIEEFRREDEQEQEQKKADEDKIVSFLKKNNPDIYKTYKKYKSKFEKSHGDERRTASKRMKEIIKKYSDKITNSKSKVTIYRHA
jgi:hypothetical protein